MTEPTAVHYIPEEGRWKRDEVTGEMLVFKNQFSAVNETNIFYRLPVQNVPIRLRFPQEFHKQMWGGEAVVQGFVKKHKNYKRRVPRFWLPTLKRSVVYSEVLDKYFSVVVTERTINLINANYGFDHYLLKVNWRTIFVNEMKYY